MGACAREELPAPRHGGGYDDNETIGYHFPISSEGYDAPEAQAFAGFNEIAAVSGATPIGGREVTSSITWTAPAHLPSGSYSVRVEVIKIVTSGCDGTLCTPPLAPAALTLTPLDTSIALAFLAPPGLPRPTRYEVRYLVGGALTPANFSTATPGDGAPPPGPAGWQESFALTSLPADSPISVGVRSVAACGAASSPTLAATATQSAQYSTLHGCFIATATAALGSPLEHPVARLRAFRDRWLLGNTLGRLVVATYYSFSPPLAQAIAGAPRLRSLARSLIEPLLHGTSP